MPDDDEERRTVVVAVATDTLRRVNAWRRASTGLKFEPQVLQLAWRQAGQLLFQLRPNYFSFEQILLNRM